jgi:DNA-binding SARP family transcriptional activator/TolB-like protein
MLRLHTLGRFELVAGDPQGERRVETQPKRLALLTYLATARPRGFHRRDELLALFWPELAQNDARLALRQALHRLRRWLGDHGIVSGSDQVSVAEAACTCDAVDFERAISEGRRAEALALYQGDFLSGVFLAEVAPELEQWIDEMRSQYRKRAAEAAKQLAVAARQTGEERDAITRAEAACRLAPDDETAVRLLIEALTASGDRSRALSVYHRFAARLKAEYGAHPSAATESLAAALRRPCPIAPVGAAAGTAPDARPPSSDSASGSTPSPPVDSIAITSLDAAALSSWVATAGASPGLQAALGDRYRIERELGRGGMATVYLAHDAKHDRPVALKVVDARVAPSVAPERFRREIALASRLQHPHIVPVHDSGETAAGQLWFTMPYVAGESLRVRLRREYQLPIDDALRIAREVALALDYSHRQGIIHRDIKPENILLADDQALVADFGIAGALTASTPGNAIADASVVLGTPEYMSPEQAVGEQRLDATTDVYSLGAVLYEMLAGKRAHTEPSAPTLAAHVSPHEPPSVRMLRPSVPFAIDRVIRKALAFAPAQRYQNAATFAKALTMAERAAPLSSATPRRLPLRAAIAGFGALGVSALFAWQVAGRLRAPVAVGTEPVRLAVLPFENVGDSVDGYFADGMTDEIRGKLAALPDLVVIASSSSNQYRHTTKPPGEIGRELGVRYLLMGRVRWDKHVGPTSRVRVEPELVEVQDVARPTTRWGQGFDSPLVDVFQVQSDIAGKVARELQVTLTPAAALVLSRPPTSSLEAYDSYLLGGELRGREAAKAFAEAVRRDSSFALAWAALGSTQASLFRNGTLRAADSTLARQAAQRAVALRPDLPEAHGAMWSYYYLVRGNLPRALAEVESGLGRAPNDFRLLTDAGITESQLGHGEAAIAHYERALQLNPRAVGTAIDLGNEYLFLKRTREARAAYGRALAIQPANLTALFRRVEVELAEGDLASARTVVRTAAPSSDPGSVAATFGQNDDLMWVLDSAQQLLLLRLPAAAFDSDRAIWALVRAQTYWLRGDSVHARIFADSARTSLEDHFRWAPRDPQARVFYGLVLSYLGRPELAIKEAQRAISLAYAAPDTWPMPYFRHQLARVYVVVGDATSALNILEPLVTRRDYLLTPRWLRIDPNFAPLRGNPRFERLISGPATLEPSRDTSTISGAAH